MIIAEFSVIPIGTGSTSVSRYVKAAISAIKNEDITVKPGAMGTVIEVRDIGELFRIIGMAHEAVFRAGAKRVVTNIKIDDRRDEEASIEGKIEALR
ncbi:MAG: thiamine-binding protein [Candidatus Altiarchaeales archaeon]|nr:MAG: thiamine-binding protein [Candidatus Altiarchaeales archaeon]RLI93677.1 MAG: thiamine-binding protein [Candidatus Altiarchaeales archaeon]RLI94403.1 MAG: thiamine-binding protein [Candidatus Altiarchaeales archaeon]HDO81962.1 MTH1187 family thiamine-binding protein [Candidatus Altiarchaeales archaeon]HEX54611.1 MTH1187 family thiamine-binding protein [Candidatus Altiarchaeales archaeon]